MKIYIQIALLLISYSVFAQSRPGMPGYSPLPAKIASTNFISTTKPKDKVKLSMSDFSKSKPSEFLHIYANYETDSSGAFTKKGEFKPVDSKFMDLYLVYEYRYRISINEVTNINSLIPKILSNKGDQLLKIKLKSYSFKKGKVKSKNVSKKYFHYTVNNHALSIDIDKSKLTGQYVDIDVFIKSRNFVQLTPVLTDGKYFTRFVHCSLPYFLRYSFPGAEDGYTLVSTSESYFKVLELDRRSKDWNTVTREHSVTVNNKLWAMNPEVENIKPIVLKGFDPSFKIDMGFSMIDLIK